jgi:hypothetical protein
MGATDLPLELAARAASAQADAKHRVEDEPYIPESLEGRFVNRRERAKKLQARMLRFSGIFNSGYMVRHAYFGSDQRQRECAVQFFDVLLDELQATDDYAALLFSVADALYASPLGVPWEP